MKHLNNTISLAFLCLFFLLASNIGRAQTNKDYSVLGSFVFNNDVYNYTYKLSSGGISSFLIERVNGLPADSLLTLGSNIDSLRSFVSNNQSQNNFNTNTALIKFIDTLKSNYSDGSKSFSLASASFDKAGKGLDSVLTVFSARVDSLLAKKTKKDSLSANIADSLIKPLLVIKRLSGKLQLGKPQLMNDFDLDIFKTVFEKELSRFEDKKLLDVYSVDLSKMAITVYTDIKARVKFSDDQPLTAYLRLPSNQVKVYIDPDDDTKFIVMNIDEIQFETEEGTIKNIYAQFSKVGESNKRFYFQNNIPISISGKFAALHFITNRIFAISPSLMYPSYKQQVDRLKPAKKGTQNTISEAYFNLAEVIEYVLSLQNYKEDYSPEDNVYKLTPTQSTIELKKQKRSKILTVKAFSDFNGINDTKPNGLIQFEASVHANLMTYRVQTGKTNLGFFTGADILGSLNKVDDNNKYFMLDETMLDNGQLTNNEKLFRIKPIDLLRHQIVGASIYTNVFKWAIPDFALTFSGNFSYGLILSGVSDSLIVKNNVAVKQPTANQRSVTSANTYSNLLLDFSPDSRYGFHVSYGLQWIDVRNEEIVRAVGISDRLAVLELGGYIATNTDSKLFFRWRHSYESFDSKVNFNQIQIGYTVDIFKSAK